MLLRALSPALTGVVGLVLLALASADAAAGSTLTVTSTADDQHGYPAGTCPSPCSLRDAISAANAVAGVDTIAFAIPGDGPFTISPLTPLPAITDPVVIDGYSQPGATPNALAVGDDAVLLIELSGGAGGEDAPTGLRIDGGGSGSTLRGLVINAFEHDGIVIAGASGITVAGSFVGVDPAGTSARRNSWRGILAYDGATACTIGGLTPAARNIISGNETGVVLANGQTSGVAIEGNYIGTDRSGRHAVGNQTGVRISTCSGNLVGGTAAGAGNVISGNHGSGVTIGNGSNNNTVQGNLVGTDALGSGALPNGGPAIWLYDGFSGAANGNLIGGLVSGAGNVIAFNTGPGVALSTYQGFPPLDNAILSNSIFGNGGLAIDLGYDGITADDPGDTDVGENELQNFPVVRTAVRVGSALRVYGTLDSTPGGTFTVQLFASPACDASGSGPAVRLLTTTSVNTDGAGHAEFTTTLGPLANRGEVVTATATAAFGSTSELSPCRSIGWGVFRRLLPSQQ